MRKTRVRFALEEDYQVHDGPNSYTDAERSLVWFTKEDYDIMRTEARHVIEAMENGTSKLTNVCTRGLGHKTRDGAYRRKMVILDSICAVLIEQERQRNECCSDEELIRNAYVEISAKNALLALEQGQRDSLFEQEEQSQSEEIATLAQTEPIKQGRSGRISRFISRVAGRKLSSSPDSWKF